MSASLSIRRSEYLDIRIRERADQQKTAGKPLVSVIIPVYYQEPAFLWRALQSCFYSADLACADVEVLLVADDCLDYRDYHIDNRIKMLTTGSVGAGPSRARNVALDVAQGDLIALLDSDDEFLPGKLADLAPMALRYGIAYDNMRIAMNGSDAQLGTLDASREFGLKPMAFFLAFDNPLSGLYRRDIIGPTRFLDEIKFSEDSAFNYEVLARNGGTAYFLAQPRHVYTIHAASLSRHSDAVQEADANYAKIIEHFDGVTDIDEGCRAEILENYARKRALNLAFGAWLNLPGNQGRTFQEFLG